MVEPAPPVRVEQGLKRVRTYLGGQLVADTVRPHLVWEVPHYPAYYLPRDDVRTELLTPTRTTRRWSGLGVSHHFTVRAGDEVAVNAAWHFPDSPVDALRDGVRFDWEGMDAWFEEDEEVFVHPRDPFKRVDILNSSRHVEVVLNGVTVADSRQPRLLFETGLPVRYYMPLVDLRMDLLRASERTTRCPYKGTAGYWSVQVGDELFPDLVWCYRAPVLESAKIAGLACFYNERVDLNVDGVLQERPVTPFS